MAFPRSLAWPFLMSGSVHLGLLLLLTVHMPTKRQEMITVDWVEKFSPAPEVAQYVGKKSSLPMETDSETVKVVRKQAQSLSQAVDFSSEQEQVGSGEAVEAEVLSAEERYKKQVARELNSKKFYPAMARKLKHQGRVIVQFNVNRDGKVLEAQVVQPSPFPTLNQSAKEMVERLKVLSPFPEEIKKTTWLFRVPVDYQM